MKRMGLAILAALLMLGCVTIGEDNGKRGPPAGKAETDIVMKLYEEADYLTHLEVKYTNKETGHKGWGILSGFVIKIDNDDYVMTAGHIHNNDWAIERVYVNFKMGIAWQEAEMVGYDEFVDVALLRFKNRHYSFPGRHAKLGTSANVKVGEKVVAMGSPLGIKDTLTCGVIMNVVSLESSTTYKYFAPFGIMKDYQGTQPSLLLHQATINPGNSGGPLLNMKGEVVGINILVFGESGNNFVTPIAAAGPIDYAKEVLDHLQRGQMRSYARLEGVKFADAEGVIIITEANNVPQLAKGDQVIAINGLKVSKVSELRYQIMFRSKPDQNVELTIKRNGQTFKVTVKLNKLRPLKK